LPAIDILLLVLSGFFALNMGGSGVAPAFGVALGSKMIRPRPAFFLYGTFVVLGALLLGKGVAKTLGNDLVPPVTFDRFTTLAVVGSAALALLAANILKIPQSTIWVTVFSITAVGLVRGNLNTDTLFRRIYPAWVALPLASFALSAGITRIFYPLRGWNYRLYEHLLKHEWKLKWLVVASSCYVALANGGNNVANVVGPLSAAKVLPMRTAFLLMAPIFGFGAALFRSPAKTVGNMVVPIGLFSASIVNIVTGTILIIASSFRIPQSLVQVNMFAVLAVSLVKDGAYQMSRHRTVWRIFALWFITPLIAAGTTWMLLVLSK